MLEVTGLSSGYGAGPDVLHDAAITVASGEAVALVGLNGAGKSTLVRSICGLLPVRSGSVLLDGVDVTRATADARARRGLMLVPEGRELCASLTVEQNLLIGTCPIPRAERKRLGSENRERVYGLFPILADRRRQLAGSLSGGQQQMVAIGRALMSAPRLLVLDEPSLGLAPLLVHEIFESLSGLKEAGLTLLLVEQNATIALRFADRAYHLELGRVVTTNQTQEIASLMVTPQRRPAAGAGAPPLALPAYSGVSGKHEIPRPQAPGTT